MPKFVTQKVLKPASTLALSLSLLGGSLAFAADFSQAQHTYVPPSLYERRIDFSQTREDQSAADDVTLEHHGDRPVRLSGSTSTTRFAPKHPYGKLPPPPPVHTHTTTTAANTAPAPHTVPPPPPYQTATLSSVAKDLHEQVRKAAVSPAVQAAFAELKKQAEDYARSGKLAEAKHVVARALQLTPHDKTLLKQLASISVERAKQFTQTADFDKATNFARQALAFDATNGEARSTLNGLLQKAGINPLDPQARLKAADLLATQGRNDEAWVEYQAADQLKPSSAARIGMGNMAFRAGQKDRAKQEYLAAAELDPTSAAAHRQLGMMKFAQNDIVGANSELSRALILDPKDKDAARTLIELWQNQVSRVPGANSHLGLARAYQLSGDLQSAQTEYRTVVRLDPDNPHLPAARQAFKLALARQEAEQAAEAARTLESQGAIPEAYDKISHAVTLSPGDAELRVYQGYLLEKMQRYDAAKQAYLEALRINPHDVLAAARIKNLPPDTGTAVGSLASAASGSLPALGATGTAASPRATAGTEVSSISTFATALRNHMLVQKSNIQKVEDAAHDMISQIGKAPPSEALVTTGGTAAAAATDPMSSSVESALAKAKAALAAAGVKSSLGTSSASATSAASAAASAPPAGAAISAPATAAISAPATAAISAPATASASNPASPGISTSGVAPPAVTPAVTDVAPPLAPPIMRGPITPQTSETLPPLAPPIAPAGTGAAPSASEQPALRGTLPLSGSSVSFQLVGASPKLTGVELNVMLRNDADQPLPIPKNVHGVIKYTNRKDADVKVQFANNMVPPHHTLNGVIHVPYDKADPTADLVIPNLLPVGSAVRDVHLTTSLAQR